MHHRIGAAHRPLESPRIGEITLDELGCSVGARTQRRKIPGMAVPEDAEAAALEIDDERSAHVTARPGDQDSSRLAHRCSAEDGEDAAFAA